MSHKASNGVRLTMNDSQQWKTASFLDNSSVKLAGEEAKDRLYEPKHKKKLVRVLTVIAYVFFVSLAAIMLSLYYVFLWDGEQKAAVRYFRNVQRQRRLYGAGCDQVLAEMQQQFTDDDAEVLKILSTVATTAEHISPENTSWPSDYEGLEDFSGASPFMKKLMDNRYDEDY